VHGVIDVTNWTGIVGIAGIAGTVLVAHLTNRAAERRMRLQQRYEDGRRFHKERGELYAKVLAASETARLKVVMIRLVRTNQSTDPWGELTPVMDQLNGATRATLLLGTTATQSAAANLLDAVIELTKHTKTEEAEFDEACRIHRAATSTFAEAARVELLPAA